MSFLKSLFVNKKAARKDIRRYVEAEYAPVEREAAYDRLIREAGFL